MMCHRCHCQHFVIFAGQMHPCPECGGVGELNCCDGLTAQPYHDSAAAMCLTLPGQDEVRYATPNLGR